MREVRLDIAISACVNAAPLSSGQAIAEHGCLDTRSHLALPDSMLVSVDALLLIRHSSLAVDKRDKLDPSFSVNTPGFMYVELLVKIFSMD